MDNSKQKNLFIGILFLLILLLIIAIVFTIRSIMAVGKGNEEIDTAREENTIDENVEKEPEEEKPVVEEPVEEEPEEEEPVVEEPEEEEPEEEKPIVEEPEEEEPEEEKPVVEEPVEEEPVEETPAENNETLTSGSVFVNVDKLNVRENPSRDSKPVANVAKNSELYVLGSSDGWVYVQFAPGMAGYVPREYVRVENANQGNAGNTNQGGQRASVNTDMVTVHQKATSDSPIVIYVNSGDSLEILETLNGWYYVKLSNGFKGYIQSTYVGQ